MIAHGTAQPKNTAAIESSANCRWPAVKADAALLLAVCPSAAHLQHCCCCSGVRKLLLWGGLCGCLPLCRRAGWLPPLVLLRPCLLLLLLPLLVLAHRPGPLPDVPLLLCALLTRCCCRVWVHQQLGQLSGTPNQRPVLLLLRRLHLSHKHPGTTLQQAKALQPLRPAGRHGRV